MWRWNEVHWCLLNISKSLACFRRERRREKDGREEREGRKGERREGREGDKGKGVNNYFSTNNAKQKFSGLLVSPTPIRIYIHPNNKFSLNFLFIAGKLNTNAFILFRSLETNSIN